MNNKMTSKIKILASSLALLGALSAPSIAEEQGVPKITPVAAAEEGTTLVTINGQPITDIEVVAFNALRGTNSSDLSTKEEQIALLNQIINITLLAQAAQQNGFDKLPQVTAAVDMARLQVLAEAQVNAFLGKYPVTEEEIKQAYDDMVNSDVLNEYKVAHILVNSEKEAQDIISALNEGKSFGELAKIHSLDGSKDAGGELGWLGKNQVVTPFANAMASLQKGKYSSAPVKTQFGWHVILLEDTRKQPPPPLEKVKDQIKAQIQETKLANFLNQLRSSAKIEVAGASPTPQPAPAPEASAAKEEAPKPAAETTQK